MMSFKKMLGRMAGKLNAWSRKIEVQVEVRKQWKYKQERSQKWRGELAKAQGEEAEKVGLRVEGLRLKLLAKTQVWIEEGRTDAGEKEIMRGFEGLNKEWEACEWEWDTGEDTSSWSSEDWDDRVEKEGGKWRKLGKFKGV